MVKRPHQPDNQENPTSPNPGATRRRGKKNTIDQRGKVWKRRGGGGPNPNSHVVTYTAPKHAHAKPSLRHPADTSHHELLGHPRQSRTTPRLGHMPNSIPKPGQRRENMQQQTWRLHTLRVMQTFRTSLQAALSPRRPPTGMHKGCIYTPESQKISASSSHRRQTKNGVPKPAHVHTQFDNNTSGGHPGNRTYR